MTNFRVVKCTYCSNEVVPDKRTVCHPHSWIPSTFTVCCDGVGVYHLGQVFVMAAIYALIIRTPDVDEDEQTDKGLQDNEQFLHKHYTGKCSTIQQIGEKYCNISVHENNFCKILHNYYVYFI